MNAPTRMPNSLQEHWLPFTANREFKADPRLLIAAQGLYYTNHQGAKILDACSGLFCVACGHGRQEITQAVTSALETIDFAPPFQYSHPAAFELAGRLAQITPGDLNRIFFCNSGSEAVDTALKIALAYQQAKGQSLRKRLVGRALSYHGVNFGGLSVGGMVNNKRHFGLELPGVLHMRHTKPAQPHFHRGQPQEHAEHAEDLLRFIELHGAEHIAACIVEPVAGSGGCILPPIGYLERLREICDQHGILLIFDEVICGFGRMGDDFAAQTFGVVPDMIIMAKALTNGCVPMGGVAAREHIYDTIVNQAADGAIEFMHGYTYSASPVAVAAALATRDIMEKENLVLSARNLSPAFLDRVFSLQGLSSVRSIRAMGMIAALDLTPTEQPGQRGSRALRALYQEGLLVKITGDSIIAAPPLTATEAHLDEMQEKLLRVLKKL